MELELSLVVAALLEQFEDGVAFVGMEDLKRDRSGKQLMLEYDPADDGVYLSLVNSSDYEDDEEVVQVEES